MEVRLVFYALGVLLFAYTLVRLCAYAWYRTKLEHLRSVRSMFSEEGDKDGSE